MKLRIFNYVSAVCFFISSATLLFIPFLNFDNGFPASAYYLAGGFWILLLSGIVLQTFLFIKTQKNKVRKSLKLEKTVLAAVSAILGIVLFFVLVFLRANSVALSINLFALLISIEGFSVICRKEKLL